jgi:hypothetical protein
MIVKPEEAHSQSDGEGYEEQFLAIKGDTDHRPQKQQKK